MIRIEDSNMTDYSSEFSCKGPYSFLHFIDNSALQGGVIKSTSSNIVLNKTYFRYNYA